MSKTLDEEWLGGEKPIDVRLKEWDLLDAIKEQDTHAVLQNVSDIMRHAAAEIRALRLLVKNQSKRIDELENELERANEPDYGPDW